MRKPSKRKRDVRGIIAEGESASVLPACPPSAHLIGHKANTTYLVAGIIALAAFLVYLPSLQNGLLDWDDGKYVTNNPMIHAFSVAMLKQAFFSFYFSIWHPLTWMSHTLDFVIWGMNPVGHHLTNIVLHSANTALVVIVALRLIGLHQQKFQHPRWLDGTGALIAAGTTGLIFGLHPIHVESVSWVAERKDVLCALFYLLSLLAYIRHISPSGNKPAYGLGLPYALCLVFFALALLSKPMAVSLPLVLLILDWHPAGRISSVSSLRVALTEKIPFILLSVGTSVLTVMAQKADIAIMEHVPLGSRLLVASDALLSYLWKMAFPVGLLPYYSYPTDIGFRYFLSAGLVAAVFAAATVMARRHKTLVSAWGYYVFTLLPVIGILQSGLQSMADRYAYLPGIAPMLMLGLLAAWGWSNATALTRSRRSAKAALLLVAVLVSTELGYLTTEQERLWHNDVALWSYAVKESPDLAIAHNYLGSAYAAQGLWDMAIAEYQTALRLDPDHSDSHNNLGFAYKSQGRPDLAVAEYQTALRLNPNSYKAHNNLGAAYAAQGLWDMAISEFQAVVRLNPDYSEAHYNLGAAYKSQGQLDSAVAEYQTALRLNPDSSETHNNLGAAYKSQGQLDRAVTEYQIALRLNPDNYAAHNNLGAIYAAQGLWERAILAFQAALRLKPDNYEAHNNLGAAYAVQGQLDMAIAEYQSALRLNPTNYNARQSLNDILSRRN